MMKYDENDAKQNVSNRKKNSLKINLRKPLTQCHVSEGHLLSSLQAGSRGHLVVHLGDAFHFFTSNHFQRSRLCHGNELVQQMMIGIFKV